MKTFVRCLAALSAMFCICSCLQEERSPEDFLVPSLAQIECSESSFVITSKVPSGSEKLVKECGFYLSTSKDMTGATQLKAAMTENSFRTDLPERAYGTTYYICSYITNGRESEIRSDVKTFVLESLDKYVTFGAPAMISYDLASRNLELTVKTEIYPGVKVSEAGLCYGSTKNIDVQGTHEVAQITADGNMSVILEDISDATQYHLRPYIKDGSYIAYGETVEFVIPAVPVVETREASEVTSEGAVIAAEVVKGADIQERGFMWMEGKGATADMKQKLVVEGTVGAYTAVLTGLLPNVEYSYCGYTVNPTGTYYGTVRTFTTKKSLPSVSSTVVSSISSNAATFSSTVTSHGGDKVTEVGFYYSDDPSVPLETAVKVNQAYSQDSFSMQVSELQVNSKYYVMAYAKNSVGASYSDIADFTTSVSKPSVKTVGSSEVTSTSAVLSGMVVSENGSPVTERGFVWIQGDDIPTVNSHKLIVDGNLAEFSATLSGLDPNKKYSYRAYATNSKGTSYGDVMMFETVAGKPSLSATSITNITGTSAIFACTVTSHGGSTVTEVGFYYSTSDVIDASAVKVSTAYSTDNFTLSASGLEVGTQYYVWAYAKNGAGESTNTVTSFKTTSAAPGVVTADAEDITSSGATLLGEVTSDNGEQVTDRGFLLKAGSGTPTTSDNVIQVLGGEGQFSAPVDELQPNKTYSFRAYAANSKGASYGETRIFTTKVGLPEVMFLSHSRLNNTTVLVYGKVTDHGGETVSQVGFIYGTTADLDPSTADKVSDSFTGDSFSFRLSDLEADTEYFVQPFATNSAGTGYGQISSFKTYAQSTDAINLAAGGTANSYIISEFGSYSFPAVKGNSSEAIDSLDTVEVLWESFGTAEKPAVGALLEGAFLEDNTVYISTAANYREGNAVVAAKAVDGRILWSWHIWLTDQPAEHDYPNNAGTLMDRNLGATSATPGDVAALGLMYQWGRKDPFLGASAIRTTYYKAESTLDWPDAVQPKEGVEPEYTVKYPTTFFLQDTYLSGNWMKTNDNNLWSSEKTKYDPCPPGWRVPDGGEGKDFWQTAGTSVQYDGSNYGMSFIGYDFTAWYPATGWLEKEDFDLVSAGDRGSLWTLAPEGAEARFMMFYPSGTINPVHSYECKADGFPVRCQKEGTGGGNGSGSGDVEEPRPEGDGEFYITGSFNGWKTGDPVYRLTVKGEWEVYERFLSSGGELKFCGVDWSDGHDRGGKWVGVNQAMALQDGGANISVPAGAYDIYIDSEGTVAYFMQPGQVPGTDDEQDDSYEHDFPTDNAINLADAGTANCYIVSKAGTYRFPAYKGNSWESVGSVAKVDVLWESFGSDSEPYKGDLIQGVSYQADMWGDAWIYFKTSDLVYSSTGNAVIAAKDATGKILWSWHIWLTSYPEEQVYANNAGVMMDRNLGAFISWQGARESLGLLYQWGRKDPFLGSSSVFYTSEALSTIDWPSSVSSDYQTGTIDYAVQHPTTFISMGSANNDWLYTGSSDVDYTRWKSVKTIYDPCPAGWRVPDGGPDGVWAKAGITMHGNYYSGYCGMTFENNGLSLWYPAAGDRSSSSGVLQSQNSYGNYWSVTPEGSGVYRFSFNSSGYQNSNSDNYPAWAFSVRCFKEGSGNGSGSGPVIEDGTTTSPHKVTVAEFLNASENYDIWYELTGKIVNIANNDYGNFTVRDATGEVYIYGMTSQFSASNDKSFAQLGLKVGDVVTLVTIRTSYNGTPQGGGPAFYISHIEGTAPEEPEETGDFESTVEWELLGYAYEDATSVINGQPGVKTLKLGTSSVNGSANLFLPAGATKLCFYGVAWSNRAGGFSIIDEWGNEAYSVSCLSNAGAVNNPPYTITVTNDDYYEIDLSAFTSVPLPSATTLTIRTWEDATRVILWGIQAR